jgi:hypothetical protein
MIMRRWFAVLCLLLLAACQAQTPATGTGAPSQSASSETSSSEQLPGNWGELGKEDKAPSKYFADEVEKTRDRMMVTLVGDCYRKMRDKPAFDRCLREDLVAKFDESGQGRKKCARQSDLDAYATCMVVGNVSYDFVRRLDADAKIDDVIWDSPRAFGDLIDKVAISNAVVACGGETTELGATRCAFDWVLSRVDLPERLAKKCAPDLVSHERTACIGEAATLRFIEEHLERGTGTSA